MTIGKTTHSTVIETYYPENFVVDITGVKPDLVNSVSLANNETLELKWLISIYPPNTKNPIVDFAFVTSIQFSDVTTYDKDLKTMTMAVYDSYSEYSKQLKALSGDAPMIEPKFEEIALTAFEVLTNAELY